MDFQIEKDIGKLNDAFRFEKTLKTNHLLSAVGPHSMRRKESTAELFGLLQRSLSTVATSNIYVALKWLLFVHQAAQVIEQLDALERLGDLLLNKLSNVKPPHKFQEYLLLRLYNPYRNYLIKMIMRKYSLLQCRREQSGLHLMENYSNYNFVNYAVKQLAAPVRQFTPYLEQQYPYLNLYIELLDQDMRAIYRRVVHVFEEHLLQRVSFIEIERLGVQIMVFNRPKTIKRMQTATADHSESPNQRQHSPQERIEVTPFLNLQNSEVCLSCLPKQ